MSFFDLDPTATQNVMDQAYQRPIGPNDINADWYQGAGTGLWNGLKTAYNRDLFNVTENPETKRKTIEAIQQYKPDPHTVGFAGQLLHGFGDTMGTLFLNFSGGNVTPQLMAAASADSFAKSQTAVHIAEGMDPATADSVGKTEGIGVGLGAVVPAGMAGSFAVRAASGAGVNLVMGAGQRAIIQNTLEKAGYADMAKQYAPFDGASVATDITIGALFGGLLGHKGAPKELVKPSDLDTALTVNNAAHVELGTAPGIPADPAARAAHVDAVNTAMEQMMRGEDVSVHPNVTEANFVEDPQATAARADTVRIVQDHLGPEWEGLQSQLRDRGLPDDTTLYDIQRASEPVRVTDQVKAMLAEHEKTGDTATLIDRLTQLKGKLEDRASLNAEKKNNPDLVRGEQWVRERMQRAERLGEITPEAHSLVKWLLDKNPAIANDMALSFQSRDVGGGNYRPLERLVTIFKGTKTDTTAVHEVLHHTERMMPSDVQQGIRTEWANQLKTLLDVATRNQDHTLMTGVDDAIKSGLGDMEARQRLMDRVKIGDLPYDFYQYTNPSEFWAVNGARLIKERAGDGWIGKAATWLKDLIEHIKSAFGLDSESAVIKGLDAVMRGDGELRGSMVYKGTTFDDITPGKGGVEKPGAGVEDRNVNGFEPDLRVRVPVGNLKLPEKPLVLTGTNMKNAARQLKGIDEALAKFPNADKSPLEWSKMMAYAMGTDDVPVPPYRFLKDINSDGAFKSLSRLSAGQIADANHGFENAQAFREAYISKSLDVETTGKLFMWSFLSRGVSPYTQEGLFIDGFHGAGQWIKKAAEGNFTEKDFAAYDEWAKSVAPKGSGQPGSGATHNLNAFGKLFLFKMGERDENGMSRLQAMHNMMEDPNVTGQQIRRWFTANTEGVGIDNKVVSFTLLVAGFKDLMVLDRVQIRQLWDDGRFGNRNLYDGRKVDGDVVAGSALSDITYGARGLLIYEAVERALQKRLENIYTALGRPEDASVGRYHWETWVADSQQEASHGTLDAILHDAKGNPDKISEVTAKEGEYGAYAYGAKYDRDASGTPFFLYGVNGGPEYRFTVPAFREFMDAIKSTKNGVVPNKFKVTEAGNAPWYERPEVNKAKLDALAREYSGKPGEAEGAGTVRPNGEGKAVSDGAGRPGLPEAGSLESLIIDRPDATVPAEGGGEEPAARALARADADITSAKQDSQGYDAAVACALRG